MAGVCLCMMGFIHLIFPEKVLDFRQKYFGNIDGLDWVYKSKRRLAAVRFIGLWFILAGLLLSLG
jgi:hypothetical protein